MQHYNDIKEEVEYTQQVWEDFRIRAGEKHFERARHWTFPQLWKNTSGAWETIGGSSTVETRTDMFSVGNLYWLYFEGRFGYHIENLYLLPETVAKDIRDFRPPGIKTWEKICRK